ncbi:hypothetical protein Scep_023872 [Stephania cephalantha]|uniref:Uncharacterized protein n=1 Tax=Stephania cephalantha TaxID=152367 RepID=A0AAP0F0Y0_9MAGN
MLDQHDVSLAIDALRLLIFKDETYSDYLHGIEESPMFFHYACFRDIFGVVILVEGITYVLDVPASLFVEGITVVQDSIFV